MTITLAPPHQDLTFMTALSGARADTLVAFLAADLPGQVADIGCGWAELLLRVVAAAPDCRGVGVDLDADAIRHGQSLAQQRGLADRVSLLAADALSAAPAQSDAVICIGSTHVWSEAPDLESPLDYAGALRAIRSRVGRGSRVVYGDGIWSAPPTPAATAALGGRADEFVDLGTLVQLATDSGFAVMAVHEASLDEWDEFESGYTACYARWLTEHEPDDPDADEVRARARRQQERYLHGYRGILGLAYLQLVAV
jgi:SAM-dependent methyltransferase